VSTGRVGGKTKGEGEQVWVVCIRYAKEVLRTMTMDPSPRERAERSQKRWLPFRWEVGSDVFKNVPNY